MDLSTTFRLGANEEDRWRASLVRYCDGEDLLYALRRYPGDLSSGEVIPEGPVTVDRKLAECVRQIVLENEDFSRSFLLRTLESRWAVDELRGQILVATPMVVRPESGFGDCVQVLAETISALLGRIPQRPARGAVGDRGVFSAFLGARGAIVELSTALGGMKALKEMADLLQMLQAQASEWLDLGVPGEAPGDPAALAGLAVATADMAEALGPRLPPAHAEIARATLEACRDAARRLGTGDAADRAFAIEELRMLLMRELPRASDALFRVSGDLPLRTFRGVLAGQDRAIVALVEVCDRLRRRLMAQSLWQKCDTLIYEIEQLFANPPATLFSDLSARIIRLKPMLDAVTGASRAQPSLSAPLENVILAFDADLPSDAGTSMLEEVPVEWFEALDAVRQPMRARALLEAQALNRDLGELLTLVPLLRDILRRVPQSGALLLET